MFHSPRAAAAAVLLCVAVAATACGKRGSPLAPFVRIPAPVTAITAVRLGSEVYVTLTVPGSNIDKSFPAAVSRVDVYAYTGYVVPPILRFADVATRVASLPVAPPPMPELPAPVPAPPFGFIDPAGAWQGTMATVRDTLTDDELVHGRELPVDPRQRARTGLTALPVLPPTGALKRFYVAIPIDLRGRPGPPGTPAELVLTMLPDPPAAVRAAYTEAAVSIAWEPSGGLVGFLLDRPLAAEPLPFEAPQFAAVGVAAPPPPADAAVPPGPTTYNVFREVGPDPLSLPSGSMPAWVIPSPVPLAPGAIAALSASDEIEFGRPRCYTVRAMRGAAPAVVMSESSAPVCVTPIDIFPPAAPTGVAAVPSAGGISLIWEPNLELDLGGYLVLRREGSDATLRQLTDSPIVDARFRDTDVTPGTRYTYSVVAVDAQLPLPNMSAESERVEEVAR